MQWFQNEVKPCNSTKREDAELISLAPEKKHRKPQACHAFSRMCYSTVLEPIVSARYAAHVSECAMNGSTPEAALTFRMREVRRMYFDLSDEKKAEIEEWRSNPANYIDADEQEPEDDPDLLPLSAEEKAARQRHTKNIELQQ